jgi:hypothetical protein
MAPPASAGAIAIDASRIAENVTTPKALSIDLTVKV